LIEKNFRWQAIINNWKKESRPGIELISGAGNPQKASKGVMTETLFDVCDRKRPLSEKRGSKLHPLRTEGREEKTSFPSKRY